MSGSRKVTLFVQCIVDSIHPEVGDAMVDIFHKLGFEIKVPTNQTCCGQPAYNSGYRHAAAIAAKHFIEIFENSDVIVCPSGSCVNMVRNHYPELLHDEPNWLKRAEELDRQRKKASRYLERQVNAQLKSLGMATGRFEIGLTPIDATHPSAHGLSSIEYRISTNPGQAAQALHKIASGGELSRISLAIQVIVANTSRIPTLVFDEVDVGIGGGVAEVVGTLLRKLSAKGQIFCVTHLPQVAAQGHQHLHVSKTTAGKAAQTRIVPLDGAAKVSEIARMLGGLEITDQSMAHAQEMFESAQN
jgi:DNA repair protein RecN